MNINNLGGGFPEPIPAKPHLIGALRQRTGNDISRVSEADGKSAEHIRDPEVIHLVEQLGQVPEIRRDVIEQVKQKLDRGEYSTRQAAEQVAGAILRES